MKKFQNRQEKQLLGDIKCYSPPSDINKMRPNYDIHDEEKLNPSGKIEKYCRNYLLYLIWDFLSRRSYSTLLTWRFRLAAIMQHHDAAADEEMRMMLTMNGRELAMYRLF